MAEDEKSVEDIEKELVQVFKGAVEVVGILVMHRSKITHDLKRLRDLIRKMADRQYDNTVRIHRVEKQANEWQEMSEALQVLSVQTDAAYSELEDVLALFQKHTTEFWKDYDKWFADSGDKHKIKIRQRQEIEEIPKRMSNVMARLRRIEKRLGIEITSKLPKTE